MKKRILSLLLAVMMILSSFCVLTIEADAAEAQWLWPAKDCYIVSSNFGWRDLNGDGVMDDKHTGIDIVGAGTTFGQPVMAGKSGTVYSYCNRYGDTEKVWTDDMTSYGNYVIIKHDDGTYSIYAHMRQSGIKTSGSVKQGDVIGYIGNSGSSYGAHLHFQIFTNPSSLGTSSLNPMPTNAEITIRNTYSLPSGWASTKQTYIFSNSYTVSFNANGGTCSTSTKSVTKGNAIGSLPSASFNGMTFQGWYTKAYGGTKVSSSTVPTDNMTLWAHYTYPTRVAFDANGGSLPTALMVATLDGINCGRAGETLVLYNNSGTTVNTNIYGVEIAVNSAGRIVDKRELNEERKLTVPEGGFVLSGQAGWDSTNGVHVGGANFVWAILDLNTDVYISVDYETNIVYVLDSYDGYLAFNKHGASNYNVGELPVPNRDGYSFDGWYTSITGGTRIYDNSTYSGRTTLYAHWSRNVTTITASSNSITMKLSDEDWRMLTLTHSAYNGSVYYEWSQNNNSVYCDWNGWSGTSASFVMRPRSIGTTTFTFNLRDASNGEIINTVTVTVTVVGVQYVVYFNANGGSCTTSSKTVTYGSNYGTLPTPTRTNYNFNGWYTSASGGTKITSSTTVNLTADQTLYAHWTHVCNSGHTYSNNSDTTCNVCGYVRVVESTTTVKTVPMYRLYNPWNGEHFYTGSSEERDLLIVAGWNYEGVSWNAPVVGEPVYRMYNPWSGDHHYTMSWEEVEFLLNAGWNYENVAWNTASSDNIPLYRLRNPWADLGSHHYTSSTKERDNLIAAGWILEGIGWYGMLK